MSGNGDRHPHSHFPQTQPERVADQTPDCLVVGPCTIVDRGILSSFIIMPSESSGYDDAKGGGGLLHSVLHTNVRTFQYDSADRTSIKDKCFEMEN